MLPLEERLALIRSVGEEIVTEEELITLLTAKPHPIAYDGFEPSGTIHLAQGVLRAINVNKMTKAGCKFKMFVADWHAWANNKMGGDLEKIQTVGEYLIEIWRATGMDLDNVEFVWASEFVTDEAYWKTVMNVARDSSLDRILRTTQIMGRSEKDKLSASQILYPCMQAADIFHLKADLTQLGMDQRKVNMLAREVGPKLGFWKPVVVSHHMLMGLSQPPAAFPLKPRISKALELFAGVSAARELTGMSPLSENVARTIGNIQSALPDFESIQTATEQLHRVHARVLNEIQKLQANPPGPSRDLLILEWKELAEQFPEALKRFDQISGEYSEWFVERATAMKMSKSNPDNAIFMTDTKEQVEQKLNKAYCPAKVVEENPVLEWMKYVVFQRDLGHPGIVTPVTVDRPEKFGGDAVFESYDALATAFAEGKLHPMDLKKTCARYVNETLDPVRLHFEKDKKARALKAKVESFQVTR